MIGKKINKQKTEQIKNIKEPLHKCSVVPKASIDFFFNVFREAVVYETSGDSPARDTAIEGTALF